MMIEKRMADIEIERAIDRLRGEILDLERAIMMESDMRAANSLEEKRQVLDKTVKELIRRKEEPSP